MSDKKTILDVEGSRLLGFEGGPLYGAAKFEDTSVGTLRLAYLQPTSGDVGCHARLYWSPSQKDISVDHIALHNLVSAMDSTLDIDFEYTLNYFVNTPEDLTKIDVNRSFSNKSPDLEELMILSRRCNWAQIKETFVTTGFVSVATVLTGVAMGSLGFAGAGLLGVAALFGMENFPAKRLYGQALRGEHHEFLSGVERATGPASEYALQRISEGHKYLRNQLPGILWSTIPLTPRFYVDVQAASRSDLIDLVSSGIARLRTPRDVNLRVIDESDRLKCSYCHDNFGEDLRIDAYEKNMTPTTLHANCFNFVNYQYPNNPYTIIDGFREEVSDLCFDEDSQIMDRKKSSRRFPLKE
jgi:hypothetical protein